MILIVDFGSQTAHLIGRRLRQLGVRCEYVLPEEALLKIKEFNPSGIIFSGGPASVYAKGAPTIDKDIFNLGIPILGICYGWQLMAHLLGGEVKSAMHEYGPETLTISKSSPLLKLPKKSYRVIVSHGDTVVKIPQNFTTIGKTSNIRFATAVNEKRNLIGIQFHPEAEHTQCGLAVLKHFAQKVCKEKLSPLSLDPKVMIARIKETVGTHQVICAVSGGVDSTVAAFLIAKAIGKNLIPVYVESGLMRPESDIWVRKVFTKEVHTSIEIVHAESRFLKALKGMSDPEQKRKTIGKLYIDIFSEVAAKHKNATFLGQGTIYSDVIESKGSKHASHIKSHHNVGGLPKDMKLKLLEPMRNYYKDEVRKIGALAGLPPEVVNQQPWPGPGYAINIVGEVTEKRLHQVKQADAIICEEMKKAKLYDNVYECWAVMTGTNSTAVKGDERMFAEVVAIRSLDSKDVMTAEWTRIPYEVLARMSSRIVNEVPDVSRVVYDITTKPPATMRWM